MRWLRRRGNAALAASVPDGGLRRFLETPPPPRGTRVRELGLLAVDLETTGLEPATDHILSIGAIGVDGLTVRFASAFGCLVNAGVDVGQSAVIHQLTDDEVAAGIDLPDALDRLFDALAGRVLLAHHTAIEVGFLSAAVRGLHGIDIAIPSVDTMRLAMRAMGEEEPRRPDALRLWRLRARAGLPGYRGHDALTDALACAELYLALAQELGATTLGSLLRG